ncbi:C2 domain-containing protein [Chytriomyces cf. hyalinus JEL632]|nr:C2 domain-containing protein [Chytriomyces cf. hyalinus JEL632]
MEEKEAGDTQDAKSSAASRLRAATVPLAALNGGNKASLRAVAELAWRAKRLSSDNLDGTPDAPMDPVEASPANSLRQSISALGPKEKFVAATNAVIATQGLAEAVADKKSDQPAPPSHAAVAAAVQKLTGLSVSDASVIPVQLHAPIVNAATAIDAIIDPIKAMIDQYIPFESIVNTLYITTGIFWAWFIGYFNLGIGWVFVIMFFVNAAYRRNFARLKGKISVENARILGLTKLEKDAETVEWMNVFLHHFWLQFEPSLSKSLFDTINPILASSKPGFLDDLALTEFTLGSTAPRIDVIRTFTQTADDMMIMELALLFVPVDEDDISPRQKRLGTIRQSKVEVVAKLGKGISIPVPVVVAEIEFRANLRLELKFGSKYPYVQRIDYVFTQTPVIDFTLRPLKALDMMDMPGLRNALDGILTSSLAGFVAPFKNSIDMDAMMNGTITDKPVGVLKLTIHEAKKLKNLELAGTSDPYVVVKIGGVEVARTKVIDSSLNPYWGQTLFVPIMSSTLEFDNPTANNDILDLEVYDSNTQQMMGAQDKFMGSVVSMPLSRWVKLLDPVLESPAVGGEVEEIPAASRKSFSSGPELTEVEKDRLVADWGTPFDDAGSDVWHPLSAREVPGKKFGEAAGSRGQIRLELSFMPLSSGDVPPPAPAVPSTTTPDAAAVENDSESVASSPVKAAEIEQAMTRGILTATIHSLKDFRTQKQSAVKCDVHLIGVDPPVGSDSLVASTPVVRKMANPAWDYPARFYVMDTNLAWCRFDVKDGARVMGAAEISVAEILKNLELKIADWDWFTLPNDAGKLRVTFNWYPLDKKFLTELTEVKSREPTGAIKFKLLKAKNLVNVEMLGRKSDPYAKISLGATALGTSFVKENTLDPVWNENFYGVVYSKHQTLNVRLWDYNNLQKDKSLGMVDVTLSDIVEYANLLENPTADFAEHVKDGFLVEKGPNGVGFHVTCPIYLKKDNSSNENLKEAVEADTASVSRTASVVASAAAEGRELAAARRQQRGFLYFEIEYYPVESEDHIPALSPKDYEFIHYQREKTAKEVNRLKALRDVKVLTVEDAEERIKSVVEKGYVGEIDPANIPLLQLPAPEQVFSRHDSGILRLHIIRGKSQDAINSYVDIRVDNVSVFTTQIQRYSTNPTWNTKADICLRSFKHQNVSILVMEANDAEKMGKDDRPIAKWNGNLLDVIGRKVLPLALGHLNLPGRTIGLEVSIGYVPLTVSLANTTRNAGILYIDLVNASHLDAVDSNGTSDPYCLISLNDELLHKSKVHKKDLNPVFNENVQTPIQFRQNSTLNFVIKDFNVIGKHVTLGTVNVDLSNIDPGQLLNMVLPLAGARSGSLHVKLFFDHQASGMKKGSSDAALTRVGDDDGNAAVKLTKGLGTGTVGSAAEVAMKLGVTEADLGGVAVDGRSDIAEPAGTIVLQILGARKLRAVDENGLADPYVLVNQLLHGKVKTLLKTKSQSKTLNPEWNESVQFKIPPSKITLVIEDKNLFKSSKPMGEVELDLHSLLKDGVTSFDTWLQVSLGGMG